jgi:hypothetical protein
MGKSDLSLRYLAAPSSLSFLRLIRETDTMNTQSQELLQNALALPDAERAEIAASLIRSLDTETDADVDAAASEIQLRVEAIDRGEVRLIPRDDVMQELRGRTHDTLVE